MNISGLLGYLAGLGRWLPGVSGDDFTNRKGDVRANPWQRHVKARRPGRRRVAELRTRRTPELVASIIERYRGGASVSNCACHFAVTREWAQSVIRASPVPEVGR